VDVFKLYDTYGFPPDLTNLLATEKGLSIDQAGFEVEMNKQKERARAGSLGANKGIGGEVVVESGSAEEKKAMARHHTATHLLHAALQKVLGAHATQSGSLVNPERLRFDFAHFQAMSPEELKRVEELVNAQIRSKLDLNIFEAKYVEAKQLGAMSLFGEKYGDVVRVVQIGDFSKELCGGTHVENTGELEEFKIIKESSISAGVRRIEALAGKRIIEDYNTQQNAALIEQQKREEQKAVQKQKEKELLKNTLKELDNFVKKQEIIAGKKILILNIGQATNEIVRTVADSAAQMLGESIILLGAEDNGKVILVAKFSPKLITKEFNANILVKKAAEIVGGGGGGKPEQAQAGGSKPEKLAEALKLAKELVAKSV
jgi:alanyl-tRNA synthetase